MSEKRFYPLKVISISQSTPDCVIVEFEIPNHLESVFQYQAGQYLTLKTDIDGQEVRRSYSLCSAPFDKNCKVGIKHIEDGLFSTFANKVLKVGDTLDVMSPNGSFTIDIQPETKRNYIAFAAGSGITPILSLIKTQLHSESNASFKLFYFNKTVSSIILKEELEALKNQFMDRLEIFYFLTKEQRNIPFLNGRLDENKLKTIFTHICHLNEIDHVFSCGPEAMILMIKDYLLTKDFPKNNNHFELFTTSGEAQREVREKIKKKFKGLTSNVTILEGGKTFNFEMEQGKNNILDEALINSADLPFACKGGVCATCKCMLKEGKVEMLLSYGLEDDEVKAGYILSCQSLPVSEKIVVDFDI